MNAITYSEVFPLIKDNKMWLGNGFQAGNAYFSTAIPKEYAEGVYNAETGLVKFRNCCWFTNIDHGRRHQPFPLMTMADNKKFNKGVQKNSKCYQSYDNYDAIEVPLANAIPSDYTGAMGVPISFLDKYCPEQFEIIGLSRYTKTQGMSKEFVEAYYKSGQTGAISEGHPDLCFYDKDNSPVVPYMRVLLKSKEEVNT